MCGLGGGEGGGVKLVIEEVILMFNNIRCSWMVGSMEGLLIISIISLLLSDLR